MTKRNRDTPFRPAAGPAVPDVATRNERGRPERERAEPGRDEKFLDTMRERFSRAQSSDTELRREAVDDVKFAFIPGEQWDARIKAKRNKSRPMFEFNRTRTAIKQVINDIRQNRPAIKIRAMDNHADKDTAEVYGGLIRNIESVSNADRAYDGATEMAVAGGIGVWRVVTEYADDSAFELDIRIREIRNPFSVHFDPAAVEWDKRDGNFLFFTEFIPEDQFEARFPDAQKSDFAGSDVPDWRQTWYADKRVRVAEYWVRERVTKTLCLMSTGETVEKTAELVSALDELAAGGVTVLRERPVESFRVRSYLVSGDAVLEGPTEWPGRWIPFVPVWGDMVNIEGREIYSGMVRHAKDPARSYNFQRTAMIEAVANMPKAPFIVTPEQIKGWENIWEGIQEENYPFLPANPDPRLGNALPQRVGPPDIPAAFIALANQDAEDLKHVTGIFDASLGAKSNESSGRAIIARQRQGATGSFHHLDNLGRAVKFTGEILMDLIPQVYDTERMVRILGPDGAEKVVAVNKTVIDQQSGRVVKLNDLSRGKYDVIVSTGPNFSSQRMEMADQLIQLSQGNQQIALLLTDLVVKNIDMPGSDEVITRIRQFMIKQGLVEPTEEEQKQMPPPDPVAGVMREAAARTAVAETAKVEGEAAQAMANVNKTRMEADEIATRIAGMEAKMMQMLSLMQRGADVDVLLADRLKAVQQ